ncbi:DoxX family protein [Mycolicibacterium elephantis]|uniref:DoxX family protein n=1 Tax=Mycolicibacterium elephantis TaxID=81858 RepID=UPI003A8623EA
MFLVAVAISSVIALMICYSATLKLTHRPQVVESYARAGVPVRWLNALAAVLFVAAAALIAGIWWPLLGTVAAVGLIGYFLMAVGFHLRAKDLANVAMPVVLMVLSASAATLHLVAH